MTEDLAEHFIGHRHIGLTAHMITELGLDHTEGAFDVGPLVIVPQELLTIEREIMKHFLPETTRSPAVDALKGNPRSRG
jgi:hypothetical protein